MNTQNSLAIVRGNEIVNTYNEVERAAMAMAKSGYFQDAREAQQAIVKILAGREMGFGVFASMTGVYIIKGRPSIGANLMAAAVKRSGRYNYKIVDMTAEVCSIDFYEAGQKIGNSTFTIEDARKAGTQNTDKFPRNMLFARAISNGVRWYCPDVFSGAPVYTPEELGANVNEQGEVIDMPQAPVITVEHQPEREAEILNELGYEPEPQSMTEAAESLGAVVHPLMELATAENVKNSEGVRYGDLDNAKLSYMTNSISKALKKEGKTIAEKEEYQLKLDAIATILAARNGGAA